MNDLNPEDPAALLRGLFEVAVAAADPLLCVPPHLPAPPRGRTVVIGAGKASAAMAKAVEDNWSGPLEGLVVTRYGYSVDCSRIEIVEASHPVPDAAGQAAAGRILEIAAGLGPDDLCLALISGGASALLSAPSPGLSLDDKQRVNQLLLRSGATISEMNCLRKHLSAIKGGRLAAACAPARLVTLMISDVPGDDPGTIGSGPTVPDATSFADALEVVERYQIELPARVRDVLETAADETPKPGDPVFENTIGAFVVRPQMSLEAAAGAARRAGFEPLLLGDAIEGEARLIAREHARMALGLKSQRGADQPPVVLLSGGELTVTINGAGAGGPNGEYMLALAEALDGAPGIHALACDTDGIDGSEDNAGAVISPDTLTRARALGVDPAAHLADNDSYGFFKAVEGLVVTGPTFTNVNDFRAVLVLS